MWPAKFLKEEIYIRDSLIEKRDLLSASIQDMPLGVPVVWVRNECVITLYSDYNR